MTKTKTYKPYPEDKLWDKYDAHYAAEADSNLFFWSTIDGQTIEIKDLRESHIKNIIKHIKGCNNEEKIVQRMKQELKRRKIEKLKESKAGKILYSE